MEFYFYNNLLRQKKKKNPCAWQVISRVISRAVQRIRQLVLLIRKDKPGRKNNDGRLPTEKDINEALQCRERRLLEGLFDIADEDSENERRN